METRKARPAQPRKHRPVKVKPGDFEPLNTKEPQISDPPSGLDVTAGTSQLTQDKAGTR